MRRISFFAFTKMLLLISCLGMSTLNAQHPEIPQSKALFRLISQRLSLMQQVALYKYQHQLPLYVPEVEKNILEKVKLDAFNLGLPVEEVQETIQVQMRIAVAIQYQWHQFWKEKGLPNDVMIPDLGSVLRPEMSRLTAEILEHIVKAKIELQNPTLHEVLSEQMDEIVDVPFVTDSQREALLNSLIAVAKAGA